MAKKTIKHDGKVFKLIFDSSEDRTHSAQIIELFFGRKEGSRLKLLVIKAWGWKTRELCEIEIYHSIYFYPDKWNALKSFVESGDSSD